MMTALAYFGVVTFIWGSMAIIALLVHLVSEVRKG